MKNTNRPEFIPAYAFDSYDWAADEEADLAEAEAYAWESYCEAEAAAERWYEEPGHNDYAGSEEDRYDRWCDSLIGR